MTTKIIEGRQRFDILTTGPNTTLTESASEVGYQRLRDGLFEQMRAVEAASGPPITEPDIRES